MLRKEIVDKFNVKKYPAIQSFELHNFYKDWDVLKNILEYFFFLQIRLKIFLSLLLLS